MFSARGESGHERRRHTSLRTRFKVRQNQTKDGGGRLTRVLSCLKRNSALSAILSSRSVLYSFISVNQKKKEILTPLTAEKQTSICLAVVVWRESSASDSCFVYW